MCKEEQKKQNQINIPEDKKEDLIDREDKNKNIQKKDKKDPEYKDIEIKENKKIEYDKVEIKRKKEDIQEKKPIIFNDDKNKGNKNSNNIKIMRKNNLKINKEVDVIEEKPEDEDIKGDNKKIKNNLNKKRASDNSSLSDFLMSQVKAK